MQGVSQSPSQPVGPAEGSERGWQEGDRKGVRAEWQCSAHARGSEWWSLEAPRKWKCTGQAGGEESAKGQPEPGHPGLLGAKSWGRSTHPYSKLALLRPQKEAPGIQKAVTS